MKKYKELSMNSLEEIQGGFPWGAVGLYILGEIVDEAVSESTESCRKNPKQWFCIKVG
ncbi:hypothetical protein ODU14_04275 [Streptococcus suis]|uniref:hypothetical protein n=1 Tax=Streptococcus suis TaxID=1307 RepID=UPI0037D1E630